MILQLIVQQQLQKKYPVVAFLLKENADKGKLGINDGMKIYNSGSFNLPDYVEKIQKDKSSFIPCLIENNLNSLNFAKASKPVVLKLNLFINFFTSLLFVSFDVARYREKDIQSDGNRKSAEALSIGEYKAKTMEIIFC
jgi:hypothetical protein